MVYKKSYKPKRKTYVKKKRYVSDNHPLTSVRMGLGFPKTMVVKQKYVDNLLFDSNIGVIDNHQFIMNGMFKPDFTGTGHQPMYFDQYMAIYNHFTVIGCKIKVTFTPHEINLVPARVSLWQNDDTTITPPTVNSMAEQSKGKVTTVGSTGDSSKVLSMTWSAKKTFGPPMANTLLRGNVTANPIETSVACISVQSPDFVNRVFVDALVEMEFITVYSELRDINGS